MPGLLDKFSSILNTISSSSSLDDLPFALWLGGYPHLEWNQRATGGGCPSPHYSLSVNTALSLHIWTKTSSRKDVTSKFNQKTHVCLALC